MQKRLRPPVKVHGGKHTLSPFIISHFPDNYQELAYCEPFCAGASVFLNKAPSATEIISDIDSGIIAILKALRDEPQEFVTRLRRTRYTERTFKMAQNKERKGFEDYIDHAVNEFVLRHMSRGGTKKTFIYSSDTAWSSALEQLSALSSRLQNTTILCADFKEILPTWDEEDTLIYLDPPYLHSAKTNGTTDEKELSVEDHIYLLQLANNARGKVVISGYSSPLYNRTLKSWKCRKKATTSQAKTKEKRVECIWFNF